MNGVSTRNYRELPCPSHQVRAKSEDRQIYMNQKCLGRHWVWGSLIVDSPASRAVRNKCLLCISHLACGLLLQQPELVKTLSNLYVYMHPLFHGLWITSKWAMLPVL